MWGLYAHEDIPANAFICQYLGELIQELPTAGFREIYYNEKEMSYTQDIINPEAYLNKMNGYEVDATFYGNESRFLNHSCQPNIKM